MGWTVIENGSVQIDLVALANTTGWSGSGNVATHDICNAGTTYLKPPAGLTITAGEVYVFSYFVNSISGGYAQPAIGDTLGAQRTTTGFSTETLTASGTSPRFSFYSNAQCEIELFAIRNVKDITTLKQRNTIAFNKKLQKWTSFYTYNPDCGFGLFIKLYTIKNGDLYVHDDNTNRNNFYGMQYSTILKFVSNALATQVKTYQSLSYQANDLLITTEDGVETNLGQISELIASDFLRYSLDDGVTAINVYSEEGLRQAAFLRDKNTEGGILNGDTLKGNYITVELVTTSNETLKLFTVSVQYIPSKTGMGGG